MRCYLAHPVTDYGGSERQLRAVATIEARGWDVENPDQPFHQEGYKRAGMSYFVDLVQCCGALAFLRFPNKKIGAGVGKEISAALDIAIPVYDVETMKRYWAEPGGVLTVDETRAEIVAIRAQSEENR